MKAVRDDEEATSDMLLVPVSGEKISDISPIQKQKRTVAKDHLDEDGAARAVNRCRNREETLQKGVGSLRKYNCWIEIPTDVTTKSVHAWEEVLQEVKKASDEYNDVSGFGGTLEKASGALERITKPLKHGRASCRHNHITFLCCAEA
ncbi:hypothetical protein BDBG_01810 [Blastomyces gilchristii SLH14081]|uniref:Uncharacterized protein n=1 Tax=Blastomyces gilchristii (strain SLH14081) TaxID=559298 RepID=A0A179UC59_BLAGS|nr:uncharacterized protein BDBG_01810 [Blastomyces gilchristii SLH14081]OAT05410.1 hypothetical protein BDBG_01810 [Blastomyces gilchristii SLH14081]